jgi:hypothetical protein
MVVAVSLHAAGIIERNALVVAEGRSARAFVGILGNPIGPNPGEIDLGYRRDGDGERRQQKQRARHSFKVRGLLSGRK